MPCAAHVTDVFLVPACVAGEPGITVGTIRASATVRQFIFSVDVQLTVTGITASVAGNIVDATSNALNTRVSLTSGSAQISAGSLGNGVQSLTNADFVGSGCVLGSSGGNITLSCSNLNLQYPFSATVAGQAVAANLVLGGTLEAVGQLSAAVVNATAPANPNLGAPAGAAAAGRRLMMSL